MISKELLSKVLQYKENGVYNIKITDYRYLTYSTKYLIGDSVVTIVDKEFKINIYELAHKCKEWATYEGYELKSSKPIVPNDEGKQVFNAWWMAWLFRMDGGYEAPQQVLRPSFLGENEPEAIFKACQYILDNKGTK